MQIKQHMDALMEKLGEKKDALPQELLPIADTVFIQVSEIAIDNFVETGDVEVDMQHARAVALAIEAVNEVMQIVVTQPADDVAAWLKEN